MLVSTVTLTVSLHISKITNMFRDTVRSSMCSTVGVEMGTSRDTALTEVAILVNMESVLVIGSQVAELTCDLSGAVETCLFEVNDALYNSRLRVEDADSASWLS